MDAEDVALLLFPILLGACVGSFLNVCIWRIPRPGMSLVRPMRSVCPRCGAAIRWHDNIPILSWALLRGRCRDCGGPIALRYVVVEALTALLFFVAARYDLAGPEPDAALFAAHAVVIAALIASSFIDIDHQIIPDELSVPGLALAPALCLVAPALQPRDGLLVRTLAGWEGFVALGRDRAGPSWSPAAVAAALLAAGALGAAGWWIWGRYARRRFDGPAPAWAVLPGAVIPAFAGGALAWTLVRPSACLEPRIVSLAAGLAGEAVGAGSIYAVGRAGTWVFRKDAMGFGDVKLMGGLGGLVGPAGVLWTFALASLLGAIVGVAVWVRTGSRRIPFGPFLAAGAVAVMFWRGYMDALLDWYVALLGGGAMR